MRSRKSAHFLRSFESIPWLDALDLDITLMRKFRKVATFYVFDIEVLFTSCGAKLLYDFRIHRIIIVWFWGLRYLRRVFFLFLLAHLL